MNSENLIQWMKDPSAMGKDASAELDAITQRFPFFQTGHLLYIKSLHNQNNFLYNHQLKVAAAYATNRKMLYELITRKAAVDSGQSAFGSEQLAVQEVASNSKEKAAELPEKIIQPEFPKKRFVSNQEEWESGMMRQLQLLHHWQTNPQEIIQKRLAEIEAEKSKKETPPVETEKAEVKKEETPTAADEINTLLYVLVEPGQSEDVSLENEATEESNEDTSWKVRTLEDESEVAIPKTVVNIPEDAVSQEIIREAITSTIEMEVDDKLPTLDELTGKVISDPHKKEEYPVFKNQKKTIVPVPDEIPVSAEKTEQTEEPAPTELTFGNWLTQLKEEEKIDQKTSKISPESGLIEKFIQEQPRIQHSKTGFYNPVNMARKSVQDSDDFVTETLARIYAKQGNIPKAIRAYQKLSLKFPEKTAYFAALIEELKRTPTK